ncbi:MAG: hypothetical protein ACI9Z9_001650, partial [Litorivivens sp.]
MPSHSLTDTIPTSDANRIESLDVFRGFALLGILLLNIIGFGLLSPSYSSPGFDLVDAGVANVFTWATIELFAEGAMRCLFSILFGAGVMLFTTGDNAKSGWIHYKRTFWLLIFGLFNAYILLWNGDILVTYALAGALLYLLRNRSAKSMFIIAAILIALMSLLHFLMAFGLKDSFDAHQRVIQMETAGESAAINTRLRDGADSWSEFAADFEMSNEEADAEVASRTTSYA